MSNYLEMANRHYELIDFGGGRKLERFGRILLDRPSPAALDQPRMLRDWSIADLKLDDRGEVLIGAKPVDPWQVQIANITFNLRVTPFGHVGVFPEQEVNWKWLQAFKFADSPAQQSPAQQSPVQQSPVQQSRPQALNLFAYTGGSTMALAKAGFEVVHVDASAPSVRWARQNAEANQLNDHPIRWIVEDARKFAAREIKRGRRYDFIVLDPPSFGHGPGGDRWQIESDLFPLLENCLQLLSDGGCWLLTAHSTSPTLDEISDWIQHARRECKIVSNRLALVDAQGRKLDSGFSVRCFL